MSGRIFVSEFSNINHIIKNKLVSQEKNIELGKNCPGEAVKVVEKVKEYASKHPDKIMITVKTFKGEFLSLHVHSEDSKVYNEFKPEYIDEETTQEHPLKKSFERIHDAQKIMAAMEKKITKLFNDLGKIARNNPDIAIIEDYDCEPTNLVLVNKLTVDKYLSAQSTFRKICKWSDLINKKYAEMAKAMIELEMNRETESCSIIGVVKTVSEIEALSAIVIKTIADDNTVPSKTYVLNYKKQNK